MSDPGPGNAIFAVRGSRNLAFSLLLLAATLAAYLPVIRNGFVNWDDPTYVSENPYLRGGLHWSTLRWAFTTFYSANWHPLTWISHALDVQWFGLNPAGHHEMTVILHGLCAILLYLALERATASPWRSLTVAALFALHPVNVESVAWIAERKNVLSLLFFLLALLTYERYALRPRVASYGAVLLAFALGLMAKPQIITLPFVLLLWDYWPLRRMAAAPSDRGPYPARQAVWLVAEKVPLFLLSAASGVMTVISEAGGGALVRGAGGLHAPIPFPFPVRLENAIVAYVRYLGHAFWPVHLSALYPHPGTSLPAWEVAVCALALVAITAAVLLARRRYLVVGWCWFLGTLVPMIGLVQVGVQALADHYAYLPYIGLFLAVTWGLADAIRACRVPRPVIAMAATLALTAAGLLTCRQVGFWHDNVTLWTHALEVTNNNFVAHDQLAAELLRLGRPEEAAPHLRAALALFPADPLANLNLGVYFLGRGEWNQAGFQFEKVLDVTADPYARAGAYMNLGTVFRAIGQYERARASYRSALQLQPANDSAHLALGLIADKMGNYAEAAAEYAGAMKIRPTDVGYLLLARALRESGRESEAQAALAQAARISPNLDQAQKTASTMLDF